MHDKWDKYNKKATNKDVIWVSSNPRVATVDQNGKVTALRRGETYITAISKDGYRVKDSCKVKVISDDFFGDLEIFGYITIRIALQSHCYWNGYLFDMEYDHIFNSIFES